MGIGLHLLLGGAASGTAILVFGGPDLTPLVPALDSEAAFIGYATPREEDSGRQAVDPLPPPSLGTASLEGVARPNNNLIPTRDGISLYRVKRGETLSGIASDLGLPLQTILWANPGLKAGRIQPGQEIRILPMSGVAHVIQAGETVETIASLYNISKEEIRAANKKSGTVLIPGEFVIIPGGEPLKKDFTVASDLPKLPPGYFALPATGWAGPLHNYNAVDIANSCGTPIQASTEGLAVRVGSPLSWNGGYGGVVEIQDPNGIMTRYAHTEENLVEEGDYVAQGKLIAKMGNTGHTIGSDGCHVHFEIHGAQQPWAKQTRTFLR